MLAGPAHKRDGWALVDYDWDPNTGLAQLTYERTPGERTPDRRATGRGDPETMRVLLPQPTSPKHAGWRADPNVRAFVDRDRDFPVRYF